MITWINFLHLYQPPTQTKAILDQVVKESYALLPQLLNRYPKFRCTLNISGSLLELWEKHGYHSLLEEYRTLAAKGKIELVGSAMYHPILALFPEEEIRRQIKLHDDISRRIFGEAYRPKGFYIPEMTYSKKVADVVRSMDFEWLVLDEIHLPSGKPDSSVRYRIADNGLSVLFRNRSFSKTFPPEFIVKHRSEIEDQGLVIAHDGELYGHWHKDDGGYYEKAFTDTGMVMSTVSEYLDTLKREEVVVLREASWESLQEEIDEKQPFILWNDRRNPIHQLFWKFAWSVIEIVNTHTDDPGYSLARRYADRGMASCAWWWATGAKLVATSPVCWNPTEIEKGVREFIGAVRSLEILPVEKRLEMEALYAQLSQLIWETHWRRYAA